MIENRHIKKFSNQLKKINNEFNRQGVRVVRKADRILFKGANDVTNTIKRSYRDTQRANYYYMRGGKKHYPSKEGQPPAIDSGQLLRNTMFDRRSLQVEIGVNKNAPYGKFLEKGTKDMKPRPFIEPAVNKHKVGIFFDLSEIIPDIATTIFRGSI